jgi:hypothetical protein
MSARFAVRSVPMMTSELSVKHLLLGEELRLDEAKLVSVPGHAAVLAGAAKIAESMRAGPCKAYGTSARNAWFFRGWSKRLLLWSVK